jgi:hypothetical protein
MSANVTAARTLGWVSVGIGLTELVAPGWLERKLFGTDAHRGVMRSLGVRELLSGMSILTEHGPTPQLKAGLWSRVAGDVVDLALLGLASRRTSRPTALAFAATVVLAITAADVLYAQRVQREPSWNGRQRVT